jgi:hypothetical protein
MSISVSSSISHHISIDVATSSTTTDDAMTTVTTQDASLVLQSTTDPSLPDDDPAFLVIGTEATAVGEVTLATTGIDAQLTASDWGSIITAEIDLLAAAASGDGNLTFTSTSANLAIGHASIVFVLTLDTTQAISDGTNSLSVSTSEIDLFAAQGVGTAPDAAEESTEPAADDTEQADGDTDPLAPISSTDGATDYSCGDDSDAAPAIDLDGNVAIADIFAHAFGSDTLVEIAADVLAIEDQLSIVLTEVILVAG